MPQPAVQNASCLALLFMLPWLAASNLLHLRSKSWPVLHATMSQSERVRRGVCVFTILLVSRCCIRQSRRVDAPKFVFFPLLYLAGTACDSFSLHAEMLCAVTPFHTVPVHVIKRVQLIVSVCCVLCAVCACACVCALTCLC